MSFDLVLVGVEVAGDEVTVAAVINQMMADLGATGTLENGVFALDNGSLVELNLAPSSLHISIRNETEAVMAAIFSLAEVTKSFVVPVDNPRAIRTPSNRRSPVEADVGGLEMHEAVDSKRLGELLTGDITAWSDFRDEVDASYTPPSRKAGFLSKLFGRKH